ncbi:MAG: L,D-transpeptidase family protein [Desulfobacterales bacterium]
MLKPMLRFFTVMLVLTAMGANSAAPDEGETPEQLSVRMQKKIEAERRRDLFTCRGELICGVADLPLFYARRGFQPAWAADATLHNAVSLVAAIHAARRDGLQTEDYHLAKIELLLEALERDRVLGLPPDPELLVDLDLLLTDAFLSLGSHLLGGRVNPETLHAEWVAFNPKTDLAGILEATLAAGQIEAALDRLRPPHAGYTDLKTALQRYRDIEARGGWPLLPENLSLKEGDGGDHIALLRQRLSVSGDLGLQETQGGNRYDGILAEAVGQFQVRHGLPPTGRIDEQTVNELNVPVAVRTRQIELNLERWRWIPHQLGARYLLVNAADYRLTVVENGQPLWDMRVVVGRDYRRTPVFSADLQYLEINPYWNVPQKIAVEDILPKVKQNPEYLVRKHFKVFENWRAGANEIDPLTVDWSKVTKRNFHFKLRKEPGPSNDLGRIKFVLPNRFAVFLHDTPNRKLFSKRYRSYSSGCIRLEKPLELAEYLLSDDPKWTYQDILRAVDSEQNRIVRLKKTVPVHLLYWTAWVDSEGGVNFRKDIYKRDPRLDLALRERPPRIELEAFGRLGDPGTAQMLTFSGAGSSSTESRHATENSKN